MQTAASPVSTIGRILIVEDEALIAMDLTRRLERAGYVVADVASSGDEAIRLAASHCPDLILMDIRIQGARDGIDIAEEIRTKFDIPVIFLTAHADDETLDRASKTRRKSAPMLALAVGLGGHH